VVVAIVLVSKVTKGVCVCVCVPLIMRSCSIFGVGEEFKGESEGGESEGGEPAGGDATGEEPTSNCLDGFGWIARRKHEKENKTNKQKNKKNKN
jgi:hypothetical protein